MTINSQSGSRSEAEAIFQRIHEAIDHVSRVARRIQFLNPVQIGSIWISAQVAKILHHHKRLIVVLVVDLGAFCDLSQYLSSRPRPIAERGNPKSRATCVMPAVASSVSTYWCC